MRESVGFYEKMGFKTLEINEQSCSMMIDLLDSEIVTAYYEQ